MTDRPDASPAPRLTRLELLGFKSFARKTVFAFEPGITAIVGPNGSGKSNIADAVRWVLGEQGQSALRAKRTEDVIFAGGQGRAPAGLAEATLTFDNSDGWLPIDFAEVAVTRRAHRAGDNQYLINGRRVRLKDVALLTASLGQSHVVVGQGLVDAALSQRAEERRGLFEHAADLTGLRLKVAEAERSLAETEVNSTRLTELLTELEPRLKSLERAARQAREWQTAHDRLRHLQRTRYRRRLIAANDDVSAATTAAATAADAVTTARAEIERLLTDGEAATHATTTTRTALAAHEARREALADTLRRLEYDRDLTAARYEALGKRREDMADTRAGLDDQAAVVTADLDHLATDLAALDAATADARAAALQRQAEATADRDQRVMIERRVAALAATLADADQRLAETTRRRALLEQRGETDGAEQDRLTAAIHERATRIDRQAAELAATDETIRVATVETAALTDRLAALAAALDEADADVVTTGNALTASDRALDEATTRLETLRRLHESGAGLYAGVRETLTAARANQLTGILGTVADLLTAPAALDTAVEVALGSHLQDVVVERWADAEAAIAHLKRAKAGRATFQPVETVRGPRGGRRPLPPDTHALPGVRGIAADLIQADATLTAIVEALLGRTLVVDDLPTARAALPHLPLGWSAVTVAGEIARAGGSVTGGAAVRESGILGRERELRDLPATITRLARTRDAARRARDAAGETNRRLTEERRAVEAARAGQRATEQERRAQRTRLVAWLTELRAEQKTAEQRLATLASEADTVANELAALTVETEQLTIEREQTETDRTAADRELADLAAAAAEGERRAAEEGQRLATLDERLRAERRREAVLRDQARAIADELALRAERAAALDGERQSLATSHERLTAEAAAMARQHTALTDQRPPLEAAVRQAESDSERMRQTIETTRTRLLDREREAGGRDLMIERTRGDLAALRQQIRDELELDDPDTLLTAPPAPDDTDDDPATTAVTMETQEREIARLKERLRRVGYVGEDAVAEFERESTHQAFLRTQLADVLGAASALRGLLADLHQTLRQRFDETFARVADAFAETFATLFGGGVAKLMLTGGDTTENGVPTPSGIDIVAQPPGKRLQSLALLSGGERALTAAALLFAILRVNPAPFCLLDEVDAALDEANVVRFREQLRVLASETQVIVVTHNRGTIETADTLYGISMGDDGVSQTLSLRLAEEAVGADVAV